MLIVPLIFLWTLGGLLVSLGMHLAWLSSKCKKEYPVKFGCFIAIFSPLGASLMLMALNWFFSPVEPSKEEIIGKYEIDRSFHPGHQADWQHEIYTMEILEDEVVVRDARTTTEWRYRIEWFFSPEYLWKITDGEKRHHMVTGGPAMIREPFGYYYVFESPLYGDVVFRRKTSVFRWLWWLVAVLGGVVLFRKKLRLLITRGVDAFQRGRRRRRDLLL